MKSVYFYSLLIFGLICSKISLIVSEKRVSQEEWHQYRFSGEPIGGIALGSESNGWSMDGNNGPVIETVMQTPANSATVETSVDTNIQSVDIGRDKLVLVNDEGSIKMLRASQLPTVNKQQSVNYEVTTPAPNTVLQMPYDHYYNKANTDKNTKFNQQVSGETNANPTQSPIQNIEYITQNYGAGHRVAGLPVAFATSSKTSDRPNMVYQENPCRVASDTPPIYIPAPQVSSMTSSRTDKKMVRIIIEMPESMTRNIDEASRYAATQVKRLKHDEAPEDTKPRRKVKKNVHEIIRKVVEMEEDSGETDGSTGMASNFDTFTETNDKHDKSLIIANNKENMGTDEQKKYVLIRRKGKLRRRDEKRIDGLQGFNKYKKVIKVYRT